MVLGKTIMKRRYKKYRPPDEIEIVAKRANDGDPDGTTTTARADVRKAINSAATLASPRPGIFHAMNKASAPPYAQNKSGE